MIKHDFAFIVHSRGRSDLPRKYPILKYCPKVVFDWLTLILPPIKVSTITGAIDYNSGKELKGLIIGIPMTAHQLLENRELALKKIRDAVIMAKSNGAKYIGLGAMTASLSHGGKKIISHIPDVYLTTGRTYTVKNITDYILYVTDTLKLDKNIIRIAIVGAAGGIGSGVAISLARNNFKKITLIDLERKLDNVKKKIADIERRASDLDIKVDHKLSAIYECKIVIAATNSPEIVIRSGDVSPGTIIINDAQPSDIDPEIIINRKDVLVIEGGVLHTSDINCHFNLGLKHKNDIFSCLAEVIILASNNEAGHFSIDDFDTKLYDRLSTLALRAGFSMCMQNDYEIIENQRLISCIK